MLFRVGEIHGGISPGERRQLLDGLRGGTLRFVVGSAMLIANDDLWEVLDRSALTIIDDVNAFDEREHLKLLEDLDCPLLFASATPNELRRFLELANEWESPLIRVYGGPLPEEPKARRTQIGAAAGVLQGAVPLAEQLGVAIAIVKRGPDGVLVRTAQGVVEVDAVPCEVVNGLGAGDAFGGALVHALLEDWSLEHAIRFANAAGSFVAARFACADAMPTLADLAAHVPAVPA